MTLWRDVGTAAKPSFLRKVTTKSTKICWRSRCANVQCGFPWEKSRKRLSLRPATHYEPALADKELSIDGDLQGIGQGICFRRHADDRQELSILLVGEAFGARHGGV